MIDTTSLKFDANGLLPAIVQDFYTGEVLTLAYMNEESLRITIQEKRTCFYSRSRQALWRKGESSGNIQHVVSIHADCDQDALVVKVERDGPACHTGADSCFFKRLYQDDSYQRFTLEILYGLITGRKETPQKDSYTSYLFAKGREKILKKVGEESAEVLIAAMKQDNAETVFEIADLCYHILVLMAECNITPDQIAEELAGRHVVDKKTKQETMK